jgi:hypothetical protein
MWKREKFEEGWRSGEVRSEEMAETGSRRAA